MTSRSVDADVQTFLTMTRLAWPEYPAGLRALRDQLGALGGIAVDSWMPSQDEIAQEYTFLTAAGDNASVLVAWRPRSPYRLGPIGPYVPRLDFLFPTAGGAAAAAEFAVRFGTVIGRRPDVVGGDRWVWAGPIEYEVGPLDGGTGRDGVRARIENRATSGRIDPRVQAWVDLYLALVASPWPTHVDGRFVLLDALGAVEDADPELNDCGWSFGSFNVPADQVRGSWLGEATAPRLPAPLLPRGSELSRVRLAFPSDWVAHDADEFATAVTQVLAVVPTPCKPPGWCLWDADRVREINIIDGGFTAEVVNVTRGL